MSKNFVDYNDASALVGKVKTELDKKAVVIQLTQAEYNALSNAEKNNGNIYFITDYNGLENPDSNIEIIIRGYYNTEDGKFYNESLFNTEVAKGANYLYIDLNTNGVYIYNFSNSSYVQVGSTGQEGAITSVRMNGVEISNNAGVIDLGTVLTSHQDISGKQNASTAVKYNGSAAVGSANKGVYIDVEGNVVPTTYEVNKVVPADAVFTDTTYSKATTSSDGLMSKEDKATIDNLADVAKSGSYNDLGNKPTIPAAVAVKGDAETNYRTGNVNITKANIGLGNVENKSSVTIRSELTSSDVTTALGFTPINRTEKGANNGVAELDSTGKVPSSQLPSFIDDVLEYNSFSDLPEIGETGKIYITKDDNKTYRWSGTAYVEISSSLALGETANTAYRGDRGKIAYDHSQATHARSDATKTEASTTNGNIKINGNETTVYTHPGSGTNPHGTTKSDVGLGNVGNFKAVSTVAGQGLTDTEKASARANIGAGTSSFSGSYNDLNDKPTIPTVNNGTLTIQKNGTNVQTFTANQSGNATANITVPTKVSELTNDSGFTSNTGTVTSVKVGTTSYNPSNGVISLPAYPVNTNTTYTITQDATDGHKFTFAGSDGSSKTITIPDNNTTYTLSSLGIGNVKNLDQSKAIKSITRNGTTFTYTCLDGTTGTFTQQDNNTWTAMVGATASANGSAGYVPAPPSDGYNTKFLRADGSWAVPPSSSSSEVINSKENNGYVLASGDAGHVFWGTNKNGHPGWRRNDEIFLENTNAYANDNGFSETGYEDSSIYDYRPFDEATFYFHDNEVFGNGAPVAGISGAAYKNGDCALRLGVINTLTGDQKYAYYKYGITILTEKNNQYGDIRYEVNNPENFRKAISVAPIFSPSDNYLLETETFLGYDTIGSKVYQMRFQIHISPDQIGNMQYYDLVDIFANNNFSPSDIYSIWLQEGAIISYSSYHRSVPIVFGLTEFEVDANTIVYTPKQNVSDMYLCLAINYIKS